jgi:two-component system, NtrC family, response regulator HydG
VLDTDGRLDLDDLPPELIEPGTDVSNEVLSHTLTETGMGESSSGLHLPTELIGKTMDDIERWAIEETLKLTAGNREEAAKILDIGARTLYRKLDKYRQD